MNSGLSNREGSAGVDARIGAGPRLFECAAWLIIAGGVTARAWGSVIQPVELWLDEVSWFERLRIGSIYEQSVRPIGFVCLNKILIQFEPIGVTSRLISFLSGACSLIVFWQIGKRIFTSRWPALVGLILMAMDPNLINQSKEFKPYATETFFHLWTLLLVIKGQQEGRVSGATLVFLAFSWMFAYNLFFVYPAAFLILAATSLKHDRQQFIRLVLVGASIIFLLGLTIFATRAPQSAEYWGNKYGVFFTGQGWPNLLEWQVNAFLKMVLMPLEDPFEFELVSIQFLVVYGVLTVIGVLGLVFSKQKRYLSLLFGLPLILLMSFNALGLWPMGVFRTNFFLMPYFLLPTLIGFDLTMTGIPEKNSATWVRKVGYLAGSLALANLVWAAKPHRTSGYWNKSDSPQATSVGDLLQTRFDQPGVNPEDCHILIDLHARGPLNFYMNRYPDPDSLFRMHGYTSDRPFTKRIYYSWRDVQVDTLHWEYQKNQHLDYIEHLIQFANATGEERRIWVIGTTYKEEWRQYFMSQILEKKGVQKTGIWRLNQGTEEYFPLVIELKISPTLSEPTEGSNRDANR